MKVGEVYVNESKSLKASDLKGKARQLQIESYEELTFDDGPKIVLSFVGAKKGLVLNVTNATRLVANLGTDEMDDWRGRKVTLYPTTTEYPKGTIVPCIRVKEEMPEIESADPDDEIPF